MNKLSKNQKGFTLVEALLIILILAVIGGVGYMVYHNNHKDTTSTTKSTASASDSNKTAKVKANVLSLASGTVTMTMPASWTYTSSDKDCQNSVGATSVVCTEGAIITPGVKLQTKYGNGTEYFNIQVSVYTNPLNHNAEDFVQNDLDWGIPSSTDTSSTTPINGYNTYFWHVINSNYHELWYSFSTTNKIVLVYARTYEPGTANGKTVGDFSQFEPQITQMANTIKIDN